MLHLPHHDGSALFVDQPNPSLGDVVTVRLRIPHSSASSAVWIRTVGDGEPLFVQAQVDFTDDIETWWYARLRIQNPVTHYRWRLTNPDRWVTQSGTLRYDPTDAGDYRLVAHRPPPDWASDAIFYQIFPDRFARSATAPAWQQFPDWSTPSGWQDPVIESTPGTLTQLYGGDFRGVEERLDHLTALGVNAIYSTPFFPGRSNHRYDATTFDHVDPLLGGDAALAQLVAALHARGIRFVGDLTTNHSGVTHDWFTRAQADATSEEAQFYSFLNHPHEYETWLGVESLPKFDHSSKGLTDRLFDAPDSVVRRYLCDPFDFDGWRIDVANMTGRSGGQDLNHQVGRQLRRTLHETSAEALLIAEHCHDASNDLVGDGWYSTMNYAGFTNAICSWLGSWFPLDHLEAPPRMRAQTGREVQQSLDAFAASISWRSRAANLNLLGSHDSVRFRSIVGDNASLHSIGTTLLMTFPGIPSVFQGDEFAMVGTHSHLSRSPLQWDQPHDQSTFNNHRNAIAARRESVALRRGGFRWVCVGDDHLTFLREHNDGVTLVHAARSTDTVDTEAIDASLLAAGYEAGHSTTSLLTGADVSLRDGLHIEGPSGAVVLQLK